MLLVEQVERQALADRQAAASLIAGGAKDVDMPEVAERRALLEASLTEEPRVLSVDSEQWELRRALGVA